MNAVQDAWAALRGERRTEAGWHVRRIHLDAACEIFAGIRQPGSVPGLLLELTADEIPAGLVLPVSRGFSVDTALLDGAGTGRARFALSLADTAYEPVFEVLCEDTAGTASRAARPRAAVRDWIGRLHVWQEFMARHGPDALGEAAIIGLFGELWMLREHLVGLVGPAAAIDAWAGPRGEPNDFALSAGCLEVKSTTRQAPDLIEISNADQLDDARSTILLAHLLLRETADGESLSDLVASLRSMAMQSSPERLGRFNDLLLGVGYVDTWAAPYERRWEVQRTDLFRVHGDFPRMRPSDLRPGVRGCRYVIEKGACAPFEIGIDALADLVRANADG